MTGVTHAPRVLLAVHEPGVRAHLRTALRDGGLSVCGEAADGATAVALAAHERPDICLLDGAMAGAATAVLRSGPGVRVVIVAASASDDDLLAAVAAGASGHLPADLQPRTLIAALHDVLAGRPGFPRRLDALLVAELRCGT
jgi:DNA-binding NarL/FixJ family response regulator